MNIPKVHRMIAVVVAANQTIAGTNHLCATVPAPRQSVLSSLRTWKKYRLLRCRHDPIRQGRGHLTIWQLTEEGKNYVQSK